MTLPFLLLSVSARASEPDPLMRPEDTRAILQALSAADMTVPDLSFPKDYVQGDGVRRDPWRLPGIEGLLHAPMAVPADAARWSGGLSAAAGSPTAALRLAAEALGVETVKAVPASTPACQAEERKAWKRLDPALKGAVCELVALATNAPGRGRGFVEAEVEETMRTLLSPDGDERWDPTESQRRTRALLPAQQGIDLSTRIAQGLVALEAVERWQTGLVDPAIWPGERLDLTVAGHLVQLGSSGADRFTSTLTLDPGGDDLYAVPEGNGLSLHLDIGGNDVWTGGEGSLGGTIGGVAVLVDRAGNDTYRAGRASLGAGVGGVGILVDEAGDDSYRGLATTQGAGAYGIGLLLDRSGGDTYDAGAYAQAYAGVRGVGALWEGGGDDLYRAGGRYPDMATRFPDRTLSLSQGFSIGLRPDAGGGLGLLVDESGNDAYEADLFAQGCSYWFARGYLVDRKGHDRYYVYQYGQGSGIHLSVAAMFDLDGKDTYSGGNLLQGSSHDLSVGWLVDRAGDDLYLGNSTAQGGSLTNSATFLLDAAGDDAYMARQPKSRGDGRFDRGMGSIGVFVDVAGTDRYDGSLTDDRAVRPWAWGIAVDGTATLPEPDEQGPIPPERVLRDPEPEPPSVRPAPTAEALAELSAADSVSCAEPPVCEAARNQLIAGGVDVFARLLPALPRDILQESYTLDAIFRGLRSPENDPKLHALLLEHLRAGPAYPAERWLVGWLAQLGIEPAGTAEALAPLVEHDNPRLRSAVANAFLTWKTAPPLLDRLLQDPDDGVRAVAASALGAAGQPPERLVALLRDPSVMVRYNAASALLARPGEQIRPALLADWKRGEHPTPASRRLVLELLGRVGGPEVNKLLASVARADADPWAQRKAAELLTGAPRFTWGP